MKEKLTTLNPTERKLAVEHYNDPGGADFAEARLNESLRDTIVKMKEVLEIAAQHPGDEDVIGLKNALMQFLWTI